MSKDYVLKKPRLPPLRGFDTCQKQWDHDFVMSDDVIALRIQRGRAVYDIDRWAVMVYHIEISSGKSAKLPVEISADSDSL